MQFCPRQERALHLQGRPLLAVTVIAQCFYQRVINVERFLPYL